MRILLIATMILGPLAVIALFTTPAAPLWLTSIAGGLALTTGTAVVAAHRVRFFARILRLVIALFAFGLLVVAVVGMFSLVSLPWLLWPMLVAGIIALVVVLAERPPPRAMPQQS